MSNHRAQNYKINLERLASGDVAKVAEVVVDLVGRDLNVGLTVGEKRMLAKARQVFASEMALTPERFTTCSCSDGHHFDPKAITRSHALRLDADIIARHTSRHVVPVSAIRTEVAA